MKKNADAKQRCLFMWVRSRGFTDAMLTETNSLVHRETITKGEHMMEFAELCGKFNLEPLSAKSKKFIDMGVAKGKYTKMPQQVWRS